MFSLHNIKVFGAAAVLLLAAACTKPAGQEAAFTPEPDLSAPIEFSEQVAEVETKGLDPMGDYYEGIELQHFGVYSWWNPKGTAFNPVSNDPNIYQVNNNVVYQGVISGKRTWKCAPSAYWPFRCNLSFFAYAPYLHHESYEFGGETLPPDIIFPSADYTQGTPRVTHTPRTSVTNQVDFCVAKPVYDRLASTEPIHFKFQHALTRIQIHVKALGTPMPSTQYRITDAIISGVAGSNTFTYNNDPDVPFIWDAVTSSTPMDGEYHLTKTKGELVATPLNNTNPSAYDTDYLHINSFDNGRLYLLPQVLTASACLELAVSAFQGDAVVSIFPPFRMTIPASQPWVAGQTIAYLVTIDISRVTIADIKAMIIPWDDAKDNTEDVIIY